MAATASPTTSPERSASPAWRRATASGPCRRLRRCGDGGGDLVERGGGLLQAGGLLLGAAGQVVGRLREFAVAVLDRNHRGQDGADDFLQFLHRAVEVAADGAELGRDVAIEPRRQVAARQLRQGGRQGFQRIGLPLGRRRAPPRPRRRSSASMSR